MWFSPGVWVSRKSALPSNPASRNRFTVGQGLSISALVKERAANPFTA